MIIKAFYHDTFSFPLPKKHRFPIQKYAQLRHQLISSGTHEEQNLVIAERVTTDQLLLVHSEEYIQDVKHGNLSQANIRSIGLPWSPELVERALRAVGSTLGASREAITNGIGISLAGGTHHAFRDHGAGFCIFNDISVAARVMQTEQRATRILIIDCDVHQGNGTANIFSGDDSVYTFSIHGANNYPFEKEISDLDIDIEDQAGDDQYLSQLDSGITLALKEAHADFAIYISGADAFEGDRLGKLSLTKAGLAKRDKQIFSRCADYQLPICVVMGGGYSPDIDDIVDIHAQTIQIACQLHKQQDILQINQTQ